MSIATVNKIETEFFYTLGELSVLPDIIRNAIDKQIEKILIQALDDAQVKIQSLFVEVKNLTDSEAEEIYNMIIPHYNKLAQKVYTQPIPNNTELNRRFNAFFQQLTQLIDEIERISDGDMFYQCLIND